MYCSKCGAAVPAGAAFCSACGQSTGGPVAGLTQTGAAQTQAGTAQPQPGVLPQSGVLPPQPVRPMAIGGVLYAGFWLRVVAAIIDNLILGVPMGFLFLLLFAGTMPMLMRGAQEGNPMGTMMVFLPRFATLGVVVIVGRWLYWSLMEASEWQATLGKKALGLYVTDLEGKRATFGRTSARFWAGRGISVVPYLGGLYYLIDCIMVAFTEQKQAIHDSIANCLVLRKA
ncbi:MAG TPA: RDD family protein [Candidatus Dormibacteraeota bacterium]|nr:RDD family protein [Candidatus Dormibacteraeota bacterium]